MTLRPQRFCSYRVFVDVLAVRMNELGSGRARYIAGDAEVLLSSLSAPYTVFKSAVKHAC